MTSELTESTGAETSAAPPAHEPLSMVVQLATLTTVVLPFAGLVAAMTLLWHVAFNWTYLAIFGAMYFLTAIGITVGFHRLFTHGSFKTSRPVKVALGVLGSMSLQGPLLTWVAVHRRHHQCSDESLDPHSPHAYGGGVWGTVRGFAHAHLGWMFRPEARDLARYTGDLRRDKALCGVSRFFLLWGVLGLALPAVVGGLVTMSWTGVLLGFLWGGLVRVFVGHHVTWSVNSVCHLWGTRDYASDDESRNNALVGILALGEGWHNNHHAFPTSARHGLRWWQIDMSYLIIRLLEMMGVASDIRKPSRERMEARRVGG